MTLIEATILGIVQGFTEFLPISSSGHLVLGQAILGIEQPGNEFEILVHLGTLASVLVVFFEDIKSLLMSINSKKTQTFILFILIGTLPAVGVGLGLKDFLDSLFDNINAVGSALIFTGIVLYSSSFAKRQNKEHTFITSILIGCAQAIAIIPGISRSGMTISAGLFLGLSPKEAARFSFLLAIPAIGGAGLLTALDVSGGFQMPISVAIAGISSSFVVGVVALKWLLGWLEQGKFHYFGIYCLVVGALTILA
ncbi:MAG: undecaprenyl-diphosphate phosphatase [Candidatus Marinimicrobia bacterium]|jgi:undecaprenyl-diphosphatase|nr:undecaprenyl-diphosphate phosphatase [Candidatus Neomarinimicrobiota bacterium]MBT3944874.1 undecaprenyl-diphosphate phosphatase [Candidatus Neomarinimicrobiota bacterium]MBT4155070.1 undecaprenyl-diphosphate phosphatase [Candidatus Neomarinimicrobiota bacterium]MBT4753154.1 undecaprenyl-diphosphate phosphatase [Candidatus Neomarinimicrobiota bacterium]MBT5116207.1 undecaprenyl-diphosphate phosphatase [Candidatus Neomarinimicrobiota bacterium]|tara:strand:+ start:9282 stop:10040 length:759 start_codon:yes stop_codon:yes gene_type:complete